MLRIIFWLAFSFSFVFAFYYWQQGEFFLIFTFLSGAAILLIIFLIQGSTVVVRHYNPSFRDTLLGISGTVCFFSSLGTISLWSWNLNEWIQYDTLLHFIEPIISIIFVAMIYEILYLRMNKGIPSAFEVILVAGFLVSFFVFAWEFFEWYGDFWWGTQMFTDPLQDKLVDFSIDIVADFYGIFLGSFLIFKNWEKWNKKWLKNKT